MPHYIVKLQTQNGPRYLDWSTVVDAPVTHGMTLQAFKTWYREERGAEGMRTLPDRLKRVESKGVSALDYVSVDELISHNRAGPKETCLTYAQLVARYCQD